MDFGGCGGTTPWVCVTHMGTSYCAAPLICVSRRRETIAPQNHNNIRILRLAPVRRV